MSSVVIVHTIFGVLSLIAGATNLSMTKGTKLHRRIGWIYAGSMYLLLFTSFFIYDAFGRFGVFHILSILSGVGLTIALYFPLFRKYHSHWIAHHYVWIAYSYIGLVMATGSHFIDMLPHWPFGIRAFLFWGLPFIIGSILIFGPGKRTLRRVAERFKAV